LRAPGGASIMPPAGWADRRVHAHLHKETAEKEEEERDIKDLHIGAQADSIIVGILFHGVFFRVLLTTQ